MTNMLVQLHASMLSYINLPLFQAMVLCQGQVTLLYLASSACLWVQSHTGFLSILGSVVDHL
jgi:hypothetical protein